MANENEQGRPEVSSELALVLALTGIVVAELAVSKAIDVERMRKLLRGFEDRIEAAFPGSTAVKQMVDLLTDGMEVVMRPSNGG